MTATTTARAQYYVFEVDGHVIVEIFNGPMHVTTRVATATVADQIDLLKRMYPDAVVDELDDPLDTADALTYANWRD